jgi:homoserine O-acetyltransferase
LVTEHLGISRIKLVVGYSMGAQQAFQWGALYSDMVRAIAPLCGSARTSPHNYLFLDGGQGRSPRRCGLCGWLVPIFAD